MELLNILKRHHIILHKKQPHQIKGKLPSIRGYVRQKIDENTYSLDVMVKFLGSSDTEHDRLLLNKMLSEDIFPCIIHHTSRKNMGIDLKIDAIRVEMYTKEKDNLITINTIGAKFSIKAESHGLEEGKEYSSDKIPCDEITKIEIDDNDENAALMIFIKFGSGWHGFMDFVYHRKDVKQKRKLAQTHLDSAKREFDAKNLPPFYNALWSTFELLIESVLLLHGEIILGADHNKILKNFEDFSKRYNLQIFDEYKKIKELRETGRYGPSYEEVEKSLSVAKNFLCTVEKFKEFVDDFLKERNVNVPVIYK